MKVYEVGSQKGVDSLRVVERAAPTAGPGQAVVKFHANSLNFRDIMVINGWYGPPKAESLIPVSDGAGEVTEVGAGVTRVKAGDRVMVSFHSRWLDGPTEPQYAGGDLGGGCDGTLTEVGAFPADALVKIPNGWSFAEAACLPCAGVTAWDCIVEAGKAKARDHVLMIGTGGVSMFGIQIALSIGAIPVIVSSSDAKLERAKAVGAKIAVNYKSDANWPKTVVAAAGGKGCDVIIESAGPGNLENSFAAAAFNARIGLIGGFARPTAPTNFMPLVGKNLNLRGITVGSRTMLEDLARALAKHGHKPVIDRTFKFDDAKAAYAYMASQAHVGKVVITH